MNIIFIKKATLFRNEYFDMASFEAESGQAIPGFIVQWDDSSAKRSDLYAGTGDQAESSFGLLTAVELSDSAKGLALKLTVVGLTEPLVLVPSDKVHEFQEVANCLVTVFERMQIF